MLRGCAAQPHGSVSSAAALAEQIQEVRGASMLLLRGNAGHQFKLGVSQQQVRLQQQSR